MAAIPTRTDAQRATDLITGLSYRRARAAIKRHLAAGDVDLDAVLAGGHRGVGDPILGRIPIGETLLALPAWGPIKVHRLLTALTIPPDTHLDRLTAANVEALARAVHDRQVSAR